MKTMKMILKWIKTGLTNLIAILGILLVSIQFIGAIPMLIDQWLIVLFIAIPISVIIGIVYGVYSLVKWIKN